VKLQAAAKPESRFLIDRNTTTRRALNCAAFLIDWPALFARQSDCWETTMIRFFGYDRCSTCRNAKKHLDALGVEYKDIDITQSSPAASVLKAILKQGDYQLNDLFNKSGMQYRELNIKEILPTLSEAEAIKLLASNGKLCKRPIVTDGKRHTVGFKADVFDETWG
jgi:arsenate reductase